MALEPGTTLGSFENERFDREARAVAALSHPNVRAPYLEKVDPLLEKRGGDTDSEKLMKRVRERWEKFEETVG